MRRVCLVCLCSLLPVGVMAGSPSGAVPTGTWGGKHVRLVVTESGGRVTYDCAAGTIDEPIRSGDDGNFEAHGRYVPERGGPRQSGEAPAKGSPAVYRGWTDGSHMRLTVTLLETQADVGSFSLVLGSPGDLDKCL